MRGRDGRCDGGSAGWHGGLDAGVGVWGRDADVAGLPGVAVLDQVLGVRAELGGAGLCCGLRGIGDAVGGNGATVRGVLACGSCGLRACACEVDAGGRDGCGGVLGVAGSLRCVSCGHRVQSVLGLGVGVPCEVGDAGLYDLGCAASVSGRSVIQHSTGRELIGLVGVHVAGSWVHAEGATLRELGRGAVLDLGQSGCESGLAGVLGVSAGDGACDGLEGQAGAWAASTGGAVCRASASAFWSRDGGCLACLFDLGIAGSLGCSSWRPSGLFFVASQELGGDAGSLGVRLGVVDVAGVRAGGDWGSDCRVLLVGAS